MYTQRSLKSKMGYSLSTSKSLANLMYGCVLSIVLSLSSMDQMHKIDLRNNNFTLPETGFLKALPSETAPTIVTGITPNISLASPNFGEL